MATRWTVLLDISLARQARFWPELQREHLTTIIDLLSLDGPKAAVNTPRGVEPVDWSGLLQPRSCMGVARFPRAIFRLGLDVHPGNTIVLREAERFDRPGWL